MNTCSSKVFILEMERHSGAESFEHYITHKGCKSRLWKGIMEIIRKRQLKRRGQMSWPDSLQKKIKNGQ